MIRQSADDFFAVLKTNMPPAGLPTPTSRKRYSEFLSEMQEEALSAGDHAVEKIPVGNGVSGFRISVPDVRTDRVVLFFHGGGFTHGSTDDHLGFCVRLARASGVTVFSIDYRLSPENPFPAPVDDALLAFRFLTGRGLHPHHILPVGIGAGGNIVLGLLLSLRDKGLPLPLAGACLSPVTDFLFPGESVQKNASRDWLTSDHLTAFRSAYLGTRDPGLSLASPVNANLRHLPRLYIQTGTHELLLSDVGKFVDRARWAGVPVQAELYEGMFHGWQLFSDEIPEGQEAIGHLGAFTANILSR